MPERISSFAMRVTHSLVAGAIIILLLVGGPANAAWLRAESPRFVIYSDGKESDLIGVAQRLEEYDAILRTVTGAKASPPVNKLTIYLVRDNAQLREITPRVSSDVQGLYLAVASGTQAMAVRHDIGSKGWLSADAIMFHEYTHHFAYQYFPANYPSWVAEGLAEYFSAVVFKPDVVEIGQYQKARVYPLRTQPWQPIINLLAPPASGRGMHMFYPQSWLVMHYLMDDPARQKKLGAYLQAVSRREDATRAFEAEMNMTLPAFDKEMKRYLAQGKILVRVVPRPLVRADVKVTSLPASADVFLLAHARLIADSLLSQDKIDMKIGGKLVADVRKAAASFPTDPLAQRTLAAGEMLYGDLTRADAALDPLLIADPQDVDALYIKAARYIVEGRRKPEQRAAIRQGQASRSGYPPA